MGKFIASCIVGIIVAWMTYVFVGLYVTHLFGVGAANGMIGAVFQGGTMLLFGGGAAGFVYHDLDRANNRIEASKREANALADENPKPRPPRRQRLRRV